MKPVAEAGTTAVTEPALSPAAEGTETTVEPTVLAEAPSAAPTSVLVPDPVAVDVDQPEGECERIAQDVLHAREGRGFLYDIAPLIVQGMENILKGSGLLGMAFDQDRDGRTENQAVMVRRPIPENTDLWFIGDVHGDLLSLCVALEYIEKTSHRRARQPWVVFLGDLFDRGELGEPVVLQVLHWVLTRRSQVCLLPGNHDEALQYHEDSGAFMSRVSPFEFAEWLNVRQDQPVSQRLGKVVIDFFKRAPRALFLPDGLLVAHGGVPLRDLSGGLSAPESLNDPRCLQDFVWTRAHPRARFKVPNRHSKTCEFGYEDFEYFCLRCSEVGGRPVARMIRGHDHLEERFCIFTKYVKNPVLTINTICYNQDEQGPHERIPCVAEWRPGRLPLVHRLHIPGRIIRQVYPEAEVASGSEA